MSTVSTGSVDPEAAQNSEAARPVCTRAELTDEIPGRQARAKEKVRVGEVSLCLAGAAILIIAAILRLYNLEQTPLHHDEGVNGYFLIRLFRDDVYHYDPANYHGPTLYYFALVTVYLFGLTTFAIRMVPAAFGVATVWIVLKLKSRIGYPAALFAAALIAVSPGAVYLSRYFIHETLFVFFTVATLAAELRYRDTGPNDAGEGSRRQLLVVAGWAALLFATKETALISVAVLVIAFRLAALYTRLRQESRVRAGRLLLSNEQQTEGGTPERARQRQSRRLATHWVPAAVCFVLLTGLLYSSLLSNPRGIVDALRTLEFWVRTGRKEHAHAWYQYLSWLWQAEAPLLVVGLLGSAVAVWRADNRFSVAAALWATGLLFAYSILPYKTPWLTLNFIVPLALAGGYGVVATCKKTMSVWLRCLAAVLALSALVMLAYRSVTLSFYHYDDDRYAYVYAHTSREFLSLVREIDGFAARSGKGRSISIAVTSPDYWPLPWYLRDYTAVGYYSKVMKSSDDLVIGSDGQIPDLEPLLGEEYETVDSYLLRPGVTLVLYAHKAAPIQQ